ncbi:MULTISPECIES: DNA gyrase inhibitor YacG [Neisseria]|uniref:DNA gyrase inhibitor YacG n=1 Tax=Neisseria dumasiana TaxID=1931275 RepID=A0A1X3DGL6_9NEIS|nr:MULTISPECIES: DNA gyrase inhibitor YacG [Neisseria]OSI15735.1 DNA gyrase inhibitor YacG [Neisseria dumasiana]OSI19050.1 DNA gyrase inhibitor YacG [Neisseria dumasiana]OSI37185.1 DNA gyrase inhibitor YacG [Neisseria dumasiana]UOO83724.1 DNA gyrase inhibitor YacG [Neisseria dumasiana]
MNDPKPIVPCPTCRKPTEWTQENKFRPFCSERCKLIDLGAWANEDYAIESEADDIYREE